jgi:hypothetical protein
MDIFILLGLQFRLHLLQEGVGRYEALKLYKWFLAVTQVTHFKAGTVASTVAGT